MVGLDINTVAVIGCGPAGLASIYELLHTTTDGTSTVGQAPAQPSKFTKIVGFELKSTSGGIWSLSFDEADLPIPPQPLLDTEQYHDANIISPGQQIPSNIAGSSEHHPITVKHDALAKELEWQRSGIFRNLFTNVPARFTRFSYMENDAKYFDEHRKIYPFMTHVELTNRINDFITSENLNDYIRFNSSVKSVYKNDHGKWNLVIKKVNHEKHQDEWYEEEFDGVIIANGHFTTPNIPYIPGLSQFNKKFPHSLMHANSYRSPEEFNNKRVLVVGGSISTINVLQYIVPRAKSVDVSSRGSQKLFSWINDAIRSEGINHKPTIESIDDNGNVTFIDKSVEAKYDKIIFTTGYHFHFPFINHDCSIKVLNRSHCTRVAGLYYNTFSIDDPSLAAVGVTCSTLAFHAMESSAAAVAGVWSGANELPSKEEQRKWEQQRLEEWGDGLLFHYYTHKHIKAEYFDKMDELMAKGRKGPIHNEGDYLDEIDIGIASIEKLFYKVKSGEYSMQDTMNP